MIQEGKQANGKYSRYFRLGATEVDLNNRVRLQALLGFFQETAGDQCEEFGSGWGKLWNEHGLCYIVVRLEIRMERYPGTGERIRVDTWPDNRLRMIFDRYAEFFDEAGNRFGSIVSQWALLDVNARHFVRPNPSIVSMPDTSTLSAPFEPSKERRPRRDNDIDAPDQAEPLSFAFSRAPVYSDFDYNGHMNNARYAEWAADTLWQLLPASDRQPSGDRVNAPCISRLDIKFRAEIPSSLMGDPISLEGELRRVNDFSGSFSIRGIANGVLHFEVEGEYNRVAS